MEREFRTVQRIVDVGSFGGTVRRYEVQPNPDLLRRYGVTLMQLQNAISNSNNTVGGDYVNEGEVAMTVRSVGLFGAGVDPVTKVLGLKDPASASSILRKEEQRRIRDIRSLVITSVNNVPVRVEDVVEGGRAADGRSRKAGSRRQPPHPSGSGRLLEARRGAAVGLDAHASRTLATATTSATSSSASCFCGRTKIPCLP